MSADSRIHPPDGVEAERPLHIFWASHRELEHQCAQVRQWAARCAGRDAHEIGRSAAAAALRCFDASVRHLHADEEVVLFPALIESMAGSDPVCIRAMIDSLTADHRLIESHWARVRPLLARIAQGEPALLAPADVEPMLTLYESHLDSEDGDLLPMAARLLSDSELQSVAQSMRQRHRSRSASRMDDRPSLY